MSEPPLRVSDFPNSVLFREVFRKSKGGTLGKSDFKKKSPEFGRPVGALAYSFKLSQNRVAYQKLASWDHPKWVKIYAQRKKKFSVNNGQLRLELPPRVAHASFSKMGVKFKV